MANNIPLGFMLAGGSLPGCITQARASLTMTMCLTNDALLGFCGTNTPSFLEINIRKTMTIRMYT
jgi:hypothetical protein